MKRFPDFETASAWVCAGKSSRVDLKPDKAKARAYLFKVAANAIVSRYKELNPFGENDFNIESPKPTDMFGTRTKWMHICGYKMFQIGFDTPMAYYRTRQYVCWLQIITENDYNLNWSKSRFGFDFYDIEKSREEQTPVSERAFYLFETIDECHKIFDLCVDTELKFYEEAGR